MPLWLYNNNAIINIVWHIYSSVYIVMNFIYKYLVLKALHCIALHCIVLYCIALYCIVYTRPYTDGPIGPLSYRHSSGVVRNPHSALAEWGIFNLRSISPQGTHLLIARRCNSITSVLASISWMTCLSATCEPRTINLSITGERITFTM